MFDESSKEIADFSIFNLPAIVSIIDVLLFASNSVIPTNPFELVEMIRRANSMNDATKPSDAIDDALKSFNSLEEK